MALELLIGNCIKVWKGIAHVSLVDTYEGRQRLAVLYTEKTARLSIEAVYSHLIVKGP